MDQGKLQRTQPTLPGIEIRPGPAMLDFIDSSFQTLDVRYEILGSYLGTSETQQLNARHQCALFSESLRKYLKLLGAYLYTPVRERIGTAELERTFAPVETETIKSIEDIALRIYRLKSLNYAASESDISALHDAFFALKAHHSTQKQVIYPLYLDLWNSDTK